MSQTETVSQYNDKFNEALQWMGRWLSCAWWSEEVAEMLRDLSIKDADVVDVGSGLGVIAVLLAEKYGAGSVMGIDVEAHLIDQSPHAQKRRGLRTGCDLNWLNPVHCRWTTNLWMLCLADARSICQTRLHFIGRRCECYAR